MRNDGSVDDEPLGCVTHKIEWITSDKGEGRRGARSQHANVLRTDNLDLIHDVGGSLRCHHQINFISNRNVLQSSEESVAVPGDSNIALNSRNCCARNSPDPSVQRQIIRTLKNRYPNLNFGDLKHSHGQTRCTQQAVLVSLNAFRGP